MNIKLIYIIIALVFVFEKASGSEFSELHPYSKLPDSFNEQDLYPYVSLGFSSLVVMVPYIINTNTGIRFAKNGVMAGIDGSLNYTTNIITNNFFIKGFIPLYFTPKDVKNSHYLGPYITYGFDNPKWIGHSGSLQQLEGIWPEFESGLTYGKNIEWGSSIYFWQINLNLISFSQKVIFNSSGGYQKGHYRFTEPMPTISFLWSLGF